MNYFYTLLLTLVAIHETVSICKKMSKKECKTCREKPITILGCSMPYETYPTERPNNRFLRKTSHENIIFFIIYDKRAKKFFIIYDETAKKQKKIYRRSEPMRAIEKIRMLYAEKKKRAKLNKKAKESQPMQSNGNIGQSSMATAYDGTDPENNPYQPAQAQNNAYQQPEVQNNAHQQPEVQNNAYQQPEVQNHAYQQPEVQNKAYQQPEVQNNVYQQREVQNNAYQQPEVQNNAHQQPEVQNNAYQQPEIQNNAYQPAQAQNNADQLMAAEDNKPKLRSQYKPQSYLSREMEKVAEFMSDEQVMRTNDGEMMRTNDREMMRKSSDDDGELNYDLTDPLSLNFVLK